jgi:hypothetical protein
MGYLWVIYGLSMGYLRVVLLIKTAAGAGYSAETIHLTAYRLDFTGRLNRKYYLRRSPFTAI